MQEYDAIKNVGSTGCFSVIGITFVTALLSSISNNLLVIIFFGSVIAITGLVISRLLSKSKKGKEIDELQNVVMGSVFDEIKSMTSTLRSELNRYSADFQSAGMPSEIVNEGGRERVVSALGNTADRNLKKNLIWIVGFWLFILNLLLK